MDLVFTLLALSLPPLLGAAWLDLLVPPQAPARSALVWGYGTLLGLVTVPLLMRLIDGLGLSPLFPVTAPVVAALIGPALWLRVRHRPTPAVATGGAAAIALPLSHRVLLILLAGLLLLRFTTLGLEILWRPLYPFDATMHWATKARVWFEAGRLLPFVDTEAWLRLGGEGVYTDHHPGYPVTIPLLQLWMNSAAGVWNESLMNLPWLLCALALGGAFYGQARFAGAGPTLAMTFTYLLLSMPLLNTHVALAGYADLFLGACYGLAIMALYNWSVTRQRWQGLLAAVFALACALVKNEGFYWLLSLVPGVFVVVLPRRTALLLLASMAILVACALLLIPGDFVVAGHSLDQLRLQFDPDAFAALLTSVFVHGSWHLFGYLFCAALVAALLLARGGLASCLAIGATLASALGLYLVLFLFTNYAVGATRFTAVGRISLQLAPAMMFLALLASRELIAAARRRGPPAPAAPAPS